ncbi:hypothetical protein GCM10023160_27360 [Brachybacterium paraconglomeratum]
MLLTPAVACAGLLAVSQVNGANVIELRILGPRGRFTDQPLVPKDAWLEGLVNAVVHRNYSMAGGHIRASIFPSHIEIESPGRFPGLADPTKPLDIVAATGHSRPWARALLEEMRASGVVRWEGKAPRDPRATWSLR